VTAEAPERTPLGPVVLGVMGFAPRSREARVATIRTALAAGITTIDTAPLYGLGESERAVGEAIAGPRAGVRARVRGGVRVVTKVGLRWDGDHGEPFLSAAGGVVVRRDGRPVSVRRDVEDSLGRLRLDALDVVLVHHPDPLVPIADTIGALLRLREEGKLHAIGVSNFDLEQVRAARDALGDVPLSYAQERYSLVDRGIEAALLPEHAAAGTGVLAYSPLAQGLLADLRLLGLPRPIVDWRRGLPEFALVNRRAIERAAAFALRPVAERHGVEPATIALSWVLSRPGVQGVVAGASAPAQVPALARAAEVSLSPGDRERLALAFDGLTIDPHPPRRRRERALGLAIRIGEAVERRLGTLRRVARAITRAGGAPPASRG
jgi:methylglyoxal reductase